MTWMPKENEALNLVNTMKKEEEKKVAQEDNEKLKRLRDILCRLIATDAITTEEAIFLLDTDGPIDWERKATIDSFKIPANPFEALAEYKYTLTGTLNEPFVVIPSTSETVFTVTTSSGTVTNPYYR